MVTKGSGANRRHPVVWDSRVTHVLEKEVHPVA